MPVHRFARTVRRVLAAAALAWLAGCASVPGGTPVRLDDTRRIAVISAFQPELTLLLSRVQDILGEINDLAVAKDYYESCTVTHPQAWFALGWISARLEELADDAQRAFDDLAASKPFWK